MRKHVILAVFKRNFWSFFSGVLGYLFIVVFVVAGGALAFSSRFFTENSPNLDQLSAWYPQLLLFIVPAITMGVWADEKKLGTDELLFTLPATDLEILLGKYLSVLVVYTLALVFSFGHVVALRVLGVPDTGLIASTYFGYWVAGAALLSAGMFASVLTSSTTVAFVLGVVVCCIPVFIGQLGNWMEGLSVQEQLRDFSLGMIPLTGLVYFIGLTVFMLYLNYVLITRRHWSAGRQADMGIQFFVRSASLAAILISFGAMSSFAAFRIDMTAEKLYSLMPATRDVVDQVASDAPVTIQAFITPADETPREYVDTRKQLIGLLRQYDQMGGSRVTVRYVEVTPFSTAAEEARHVGIQPTEVQDNADGKVTVEEMFLGAVVQSKHDEVVIPFFGKGLPIEYELTRSVQTVSNAERLTVGVLRTDANVIGPSNDWPIITELRKQYEVEEVSPTGKIDPDKFDVLLAIAPSSLTQPEMQVLVDYVESGEPVLIFDDPYPMVFGSAFGLTAAPRLPKPRPGGGMGGMMGMQMQQQPPEQKADGGKATSLMSALNVAWDNGRSVFDDYNPHAQFQMLPQEYLFISPQNSASAFDQESKITSGLQEMVAIYAGTIQPRKSRDGIEFTPLLATGGNSGLLEWENYVNESFSPFSMSSTAQAKRNPFRVMDENSHALAAHITSTDKDNPRNVVFVSDIDMIAGFFFEEWNRGQLDFQLDNVTFVLNAVDVLADENAFIDLRKRRAKARTLKKVEDYTREYEKERNKAEKEADDEMEKELEDTKERFDKQIKEIEGNDSLDPRARDIKIQQLRENHERMLTITEANLTRRKEEQIRLAKARAARQTKKIQNNFSVAAIVLSPLPALFFGLVFLGMRISNERSQLDPTRRRHS